MRRTLSTLALVISGGVVGALASAFLVQHQGGPSSPAQTVGLAPPKGGTSSDLTTRLQLAAMAARVSQLEQEKDGREEGQDQERAHAPEPQAARPLTEEESRALHEEDFDNKLADHARDSVDSTWAPAARSNFVNDLSAIASDSKFHLVGVDCRTSTCVAEVEWSNYGDAVSEFGSVLHARYKQNCGSTILLPEPPDLAVRYRAKAVFECGEAND